jgi:hypothetical protein
MNCIIWNKETIWRDRKGGDLRNEGQANWYDKSGNLKCVIKYRKPNFIEQTKIENGEQIAILVNKVETTIVQNNQYVRLIISTDDIEAIDF